MILTFERLISLDPIQTKQNYLETEPLYLLHLLYINCDLKQKSEIYFKMLADGDVIKDYDRFYDFVNTTF